MGKADRTLLEEQLTHYYASRREAVDAEKIGTLASVMVAEDAKMPHVRNCRTGAAEFIMSQVRYIPAWTWVAQAAIVALMCALAHEVGDTDATKVSIGILSAMAVLVGVPTIQASRTYSGVRNIRLVVSLPTSCTIQTDFLFESYRIESRKVW